MENFNFKSNASGEAKSRYANILLDYWFKRSFGTEINKRLMILLLREILPEAGVQDISYNNKEHTNPIPDKHGVIFDIECTSNDGTKFIVEMQLAQQDSFMERAIFYSSFAIQDQISKGKKEYDFLPIYFIALMDFSLHEDGRFLYRYELIEKDSGEMMTDRIHFLFLELPNVRQISGSSSNLEKFCYAMHNMSVLKSRPPEMQAEIFELLFNSAEIAKFTPEEKIRYEYDMTTERDRLNQLAFSRKEGKAEGLKEGKAKGVIEGRNEAREAIAKKLSQKGFSPEEITEIIGPEEA